MGLFGFVSFAYGLVMGIRSELPQLDPARSSHRLEQNGYIYDSSGKRVLAVLRGSEARVLIASDDIAPVMKQAIVAIEDRRFFEHRGVDIHGILRAVCIVGRPVARHFDDGQTLEVNRTATDGTRNANSMLYGAAARAAFALGYTRLITYTQASESGSSLKAAGWKVIAQREARLGWTTPSRPRSDIRSSGVARQLWEVVA